MSWAFIMGPSRRGIGHTCAQGTLQRPQAGAALRQCCQPAAAAGPCAACAPLCWPAAWPPAGCLHR